MTLTLTATVPPIGEPPVMVECTVCKGEKTTLTALYKCPHCKHEYSSAESLKALTLKCPECEDFIRDEDREECRIGSRGQLCPGCDGEGTRAVRYEVVAEVDYWTTSKASGFMMLAASGKIGGSGNHPKKAQEHLARELVKALRTGQQFPGVTITEILEESSGSKN